MYWVPLIPLINNFFSQGYAGFEAIRYKGNLPLRGLSGLAILSGVTALCAYGFYLSERETSRRGAKEEALMCEPFWSARDRKRVK